jgi:hypothetical protein
MTKCVEGISTSTCDFSPGSPGWRELLLESNIIDITVREKNFDKNWKRLLDCVKINNNGDPGHLASVNVRLILCSPLKYSISHQILWK